MSQEPYSGGLLSRVKRHQWHAVAVGLLGMLLVLVLPFYAVLAATGKQYSVATAPRRAVAIVFGAGLMQNGLPSHFLESRLNAAIRLYRQGTVKVLLMSGDNSRRSYDEPTAMKAYVVLHGVPSRSVVLDYAGFDTYDTCYRAHALFGVTSAILVTHAYHLPRALLDCNALGVRSIGVRADGTGHFSRNYVLREIAAINEGVLRLAVRSKPTYLGPHEAGVYNALLASR